MWQSPEGREHPLAGRVWEVSARAFVTPAEVEARARSARLLLLGETHDNPDHHLLQARLLGAAATASTALVVEMIDRELQPKVDAARASPHGVDVLAAAVDWERAGWPEWSLYRPVFEEAWRRGLPIIAANLDRPKAREISAGRLEVDPALRARHDLDAPLPEALRAAWIADLDASHCGHMPAKMIEPMLLIQRVRDALMADAMEAAPRAVLIAGREHVRRDRGAAVYLERRGLPALVIAFVDVQDGLEDPEGYREQWNGGLPFDLLWFTPRGPATDHCAALEEMMKKMKAKSSAAPAG